MTDIKPIQTRYAGRYFRSRLEARWAVFFDAVNVKYDYEPEGFDLGEYGLYLPDFYIPELGSYVEIKRREAGLAPRPEEFKTDLNKCSILSLHLETNVFVICGPPSIEDPPEIIRFDRCGMNNYGLYFSMCVMCKAIALLESHFKPYRDEIIWMNADKNKFAPSRASC